MSNPQIPQGSDRFLRRDGQDLVILPKTNDFTSLDCIPPDSPWRPWVAAMAIEEHGLLKEAVREEYNVLRTANVSSAARPKAIQDQMEVLDESWHEHNDAQDAWREWGRDNA